MKQKVIVLLVLVSVVSWLAACNEGRTNAPASSTNAPGSTPSTARAAATPTADEIRAVLAAHDKALNDKNLDAIMATFSTDPQTVVLGTGTEERWVGPNEIRTAYTEMIKDYDPGTLQAVCDWKTGDADDAGTMAWLAASCTCKDSLQGKPREYKLNVSGTLEKQNNKWVFVSLHMSNAFQPPVSK